MRAFLPAFVLFVFGFAGCGDASDKAVQPTPPETAPVEAVEFSEARIGDKRATVCRVDIRKAHLQLFLRDDSGQPIKRFDRLAAMLKSRDQKLVFAMNAGMYHADFSPVGLFVADGRELFPINTNNGSGNFFLKPNGVFVITETGARVVETSEYSQIKERVTLATQSGPLLVHSGKIHPVFNANSESRLIRNGVGIPSPDAVVFVITEEPVNFHEFAIFFRDTLHCPDALFLDGTVSSLYSTKLTRSDAKVDLGTFIAITQ